MSTVFTPLELNCIIDLLEQASSIHSFSVYGESFNARQSSNIEQMNSIIIRHVNGSKLRQLQVPVCNVTQVQMLLNRFRSLCSIQFVSFTQSLTCDKLIAYVKASMPGCSTLSDSGVASIWLGERKEATSYSTTLASGFRSVRQSVKSLFQWTESTSAIFYGVTSKVKAYFRYYPNLFSPIPTNNFRMSDSKFFMKYLTKAKSAFISTIHHTGYLQHLHRIVMLIRYE